MLLPALAPVAPALQPLDDDAGSGGDAGDSWDAATRIEPGVYGGRLSSGVDRADHYVFHVDAGDGIRIGIRGQGSPEIPFIHFRSDDRVNLELRDPSGETVPRPWRGLVADLAGDWTLKVDRSHTFARIWFYGNVSGETTLYAQLDYVLDLEVGTPWPQYDAGSGADAPETLDDATPLPVGPSKGELGRYDPADAYAFDVPAGEAYRVQFDGDDQWAELSDASGKSRPFADVVENDTRIFVRIEGGEGVYALDLEMRGRVGFHPVLTDLASVGALVPADDGVDAFTDRGLVRVNATGSELVRPGVYSPYAARDANGRIVASMHDGIQRLDASGLTPVTPQRGPLAFGPDGNLYVVSVTASSSRFFSPAPPQAGLLRVTPDRAVEEVVRFDLKEISTPDALAFTPDGILHLLGGDSLVSVNVTTGAVRAASLPFFAGGLAADEQGRLYTLERATRGLHRLHPGEPGAVEWLRGPLPLETDRLHFAGLAFEGTDLYVGYGSGPRDEAAEAALGFYELGVEGFPGFTPAFDLPPLPDLVVTSVEVENDSVAAHPRVVVEVENRGEGPAPAGIPVDVHTRCGGSIDEEVPRWPLGQLVVPRPDQIPDSGLTGRFWVIWDYLAGGELPAGELWNETLFPAPPERPQDDRAWCGDSLGRARLGALAPGGREVVEIPWDTGRSVGDHWVIAHVDAGDPDPRWFSCDTPGGHFETDETNNCAFTKASVIVSGGGFGASVFG